MLLLKNMLFTVFVPGAVAVFVPLVAFPLIESTNAALALAGRLALLIGGTIYFWCLWDFATTGRGTPAPIDPPKQLVVRGLYKYVRNPMYLGVLGVIFGWALLFGSVSIVIYGVCIAAAFHLFVIIYEEPRLRQTFGASYEEYCSQVRRWLPAPNH